MAEHKHAEVLRAIADGKDVQFKNLSNGAWMDCFDSGRVNPIEHSHFEWRVKPEPKPDYVAEGWVIRAGTPLVRSCNIIIDGETNEPKSVELIK